MCVVYGCEMQSRTAYAFRGAASATKSGANAPECDFQLDTVSTRRCMPAGGVRYQSRIDQIAALQLGSRLTIANDGNAANLWCVGWGIFLNRGRGIANLIDVDHRMAAIIIGSCTVDDYQQFP